MFILGDQPELDPMVIERLLNVYRETGAPIVQPRYHEGPGHPVLIDRSLFPELSALQGDIGARPVIQRYRELVQRVDVTGFSRPDDIDTWEDYERVSTRIMQRLRSSYEL
jgi:molybdenum cofactor cytidylyltransferase